MHFPLIHITHELGKINFFVLLATTSLLYYLHNKRADNPMTSQKATVLTVEFTKTLLMKPGSDNHCAESRGLPATKLDAVSGDLDEGIPQETLSTFLWKKGRSPFGMNLSPLLEHGAAARKKRKNISGSVCPRA